MERNAEPLGQEAGVGKDGGLEAEPGEAGLQGAREHGRERTRDGRAEALKWLEEGLSPEMGGEGRGAGAAAQAYMEDPSKAPAMGTTSSFGTIAGTLEERMAFWDLVHDHESPKGGRTQARVVLELPHEATARERHEMVRLYTEELREKGIPFWASIHEPTRANDSRNHHAHVVFTDRPMRRMRHPETGAEAWDFTVAEVYKTSSRNKLTRYPYRQNRDPEMRDRGYVKKSRQRFADIVNRVMEASGRPVRYDARSYKDMGLDAAPMRNVSRILADKLGTRSFVVMDAEWTRRMIDAEMQAAATRREGTFAALAASERALAESARATTAGRRAAARLPAALRPSLLRTLGREAAGLAARKVLEARRDALARRFEDEAALKALRHIEAATSPSAVGKRALDPSRAPDAAEVAALNEAAREEIAALSLSSRARSALAAERTRRAEAAWRDGPTVGRGSALAAPAAPDPPAAPPFGRPSAGTGTPPVPTPGPPMEAHAGRRAGRGSVQTPDATSVERAAERSQPRGASQLDHAASGGMGNPIGIRPARAAASQAERMLQIGGAMAATAAAAIRGQVEEAVRERSRRAAEVAAAARENGAAARAQQDRARKAEPNPPEGTQRGTGQGLTASTRHEAPTRTRSSTTATEGQRVAEATPKGTATPSRTKTDGTAPTMAATQAPRTPTGATEAPEGITPSTGPATREPSRRTGTTTERLRPESAGNADRPLTGAVATERPADGTAADEGKSIRPASPKGNTIPKMEVGEGMTREGTAPGGGAPTPMAENTAPAAGTGTGTAPNDGPEGQASKEGGDGPEDPKAAARRRRRAILAVNQRGRVSRLKG